MDIKTVGTHIKIARERLSMSQSELARRIGIQQSNLSRLERGLQGVSLDTLGMFARVLGVSVSELTAERERQSGAAVNGNLDARLSVHADKTAAPGLRELSGDVSLCESLRITPEEWRQLAAIPLPHTVTKAGFLQVLITLRAVQTPPESVSVTES